MDRYISYLKDAFRNIERRTSRLEQIELVLPQLLSVGTYGEAHTNKVLTTSWQNILDGSASLGMPYGNYIWQVNFIFQSSTADAGFVAEGGISIDGVMQPTTGVVTLTGNGVYLTVTQSWFVYASSQDPLNNTLIRMYARKSGGTGSSVLEARTTFSVIGERFRPDEV